MRVLSVLSSVAVLRATAAAAAAARRPRSAVLLRSLASFARPPAALLPLLRSFSSVSSSAPASSSTASTASSSSSSSSSSSQSASSSSSGDASASSSSAASASWATALNFDDVRASFSHKTTLELLRAQLVLQLAAVPLITNNARRLYDAARRVLGSRLTELGLQATFFGHFCAGRDRDEVRTATARLAQAGIGAILDYAAEADVRDAPHKEGVHSARIFDYYGEEECDANTRHVHYCIESTPPGGFAAVKVTALGDVKLLESMTQSLHETRRLFRKFGKIGQHRPGYYSSTRIDAEQFYDGLHELGIRMTAAEALDMFRRIDTSGDGRVDYLEWINYLWPFDKYGNRVFVEGSVTGEGPLRPMSEVEASRLRAMMTRLESLASASKERGVRLMIDAEQTYFQPAIDHIVSSLQRKYNRSEAIVYGTYQCYLKDSEGRMRVDLARAEREGYRFGCKIVRGAYMFQERVRAAQRSYPSPIFETIEETHANYNAAIDLLMDNLVRAEFMVASHNENSIRYAVRRMAELDVDRKTGGVSFGQLLGMCDHVTFGLGRAGCRVFKYVPFGPVHDVLPYLIRRMEENAGALTGAARSRKLVATELKRRLFFVGGR